MVWIVGAVCMIFFGIALVVIGVVVDILRYAIGGILVLAGIFLLASIRRSRGDRPPLLRWAAGCSAGWLRSSCAAA
jgi:uncharacterized membrane protein HdeD (DUF308 family)